MLTAQEYDQQWSKLSDFIRHNPGARHRRRLIGEAISRIHKSFGTILDVGCGLGEVILDLKPRYPSARFTGIDISEVAVEACRASHPDDRFELCDITAGKLDQSFDLVVCSEVTEHLDDVPGALRNMRAMTKTGGILVLTTPHGRIHPTERAIGHIKHPGRAELSELLAEAGYQVIQIRQWGWPGYTALKYLANLMPRTTMHHLGSGDYGSTAIAINRVAYHVTGWLSVPTSPWGPQFVVTAQGIN